MYTNVLNVPVPVPCGWQEGEHQRFPGFDEPPTVAPLGPAGAGQVETSPLYHRPLLDTRIHPSSPHS